MRVLELMKSHVIKAAPDATVRDVVDMFDLYQVTALPVVDAEDRLVGMVTESDIVRLLLPEVADDGAGPAGPVPATAPAMKEATVTQVMTAPAVAVEENCDIREAASIMRAGRIKRLPVTS